MLKTWFFTFLAAICTALQLCATTKNTLEDNIDLRDRGIHQSFENGKVYLFSDRLHTSNDCWFFVNDQLQFIPIKALYQDTDGYLVNLAAILCDNGHPGYRKIGGKWYCLDDGCTWFLGDR